MIFRRRYKKQDDAALTLLVAEGDEDAFRELLHRHQDAVYGFARRFLGDPQEAEDAAQETFIRFYRAAHRYRPQAAFRTYLFRIAKNICIDNLRKKRPELMEDLPETVATDTPLDLLEGAIEAVQLEQAIAGLPVNQRTALLLRHDEQLPYSQIAEVMDISIKAVESLLVRARRTLRLNLSLPDHT